MDEHLELFQFESDAGEKYFRENVREAVIMEQC